MAALVTNKAPSLIFIKYSNVADIFFSKLTSIFLKHIGINNHVIKLIDKQQPSYGPIYSLRLVELKTLKTYIEINLANSFIKYFKSPIKAFIFFDKKPNRSL